MPKKPAMPNMVNISQNNTGANHAPGIKNVKPSIVNRIGQASIRKPLAWLTVIYIMLLAPSAALFYGDIPPNVTSVIQWLIAIPLAVVGSSSWEHIHDCKGEDSHEEQPFYNPDDTAGSGGDMRGDSSGHGS
jgi:hypothetical protein